MSRKESIDRNLELYHDYMLGMKQCDIAKKYNISGARVSCLITKLSKFKKFQLKYESKHGCQKKISTFSDRNIKIYFDYKQGIRRFDIAKKYSLSQVSICRIIYNCNKSEKFQEEYTSINKK